MKKIQLAISMMAVFTALFASSVSWAESSVEPDNSAMNKRDRGGQTLTSMDQSGNPEDLRITKEIRQQLMADKALSVNARNIKIITVDGVVTVRGPVKDAAEKAAVDRHVRQIAPNSTMVNQLEIKSMVKA